MIPDNAVLVDRAIDAEYLDASAAAVRYVRLQAARVLADMGFWDAGARHRSIEELATSTGVVPAALPAFEWLIVEAVAGGRASKTADARYAAQDAPPSPGDLAHAARDLGSHAPVVGSSVAMLDYAAERYPLVLTGRRSALSIFMKGEGLAHWERYFSSANPLYDVHNRLAAEGLCSVWPGLATPPRILELGTGTGGATAAIVGALGRLPGGPEADLVMSDISPSFLVRAAERFQASGCRLRTMRLDFSRSLEAQGVPAGTIDAIVATNALHGAADLAAALQHLRRVVAPGGALIVSESLCAPGASVHQDFVFNLLGGLPAASDGRSRFLSSARWSAALESSGWRAGVLANSAGPELAMLAIAS